jgi:uncharacterized protein YeaC (DUF1315 family)
MKLFAIRKECGDLIILSAESEFDALHQAGMDMDAVKLAVEQLRHGPGPTIDAETIMRSGIGPQAYEIRELPSVFIDLKLDETGDFELSDFSSEIRDAVDGMYPIIEAATDRAIEIWPDGVMLDEEGRRAYWQLMAEAIEQERQRLRQSSSSLATRSATSSRVN